MHASRTVVVPLEQFGLKLMENFLHFQLSFLFTVAQSFAFVSRPFS